MNCKTCTKCNVEKPISEFYQHKSGKHGVASRCKKCCVAYAKQRNQSAKYRTHQKEYQKEYRQRPEAKKRLKESRQTEKGRLSNRRASLKQLYDLTLEGYNKLFQQQEGCCAICGRHQSVFKQRLHVDHDHGTKRIRGLLCSQCNLGLGNFRHDNCYLQNAIHYLEKK